MKKSTTNWLFFRHFRILAAVLLLSMLFTACARDKKSYDYTIGFSQCTLVNEWRQKMLDEMQRELSFHPEVNFVYRDANGSSGKQVEQIQELIDLGVDLLIVSPNEAEPITSIVEKAYRQGIKVIIVDRRTLSDNYTAYVGASNFEVGATAASFANTLLKGKGNVLEISDLPGSSADIDRHRGFVENLENYPDVHFVSKLYEQGDEHPSYENTTRFLKSRPAIDLIFAQNDRLAFSAFKACKQLGLTQKIRIIGVDGLAGDNGGINLVEQGILNGTILYPTGGEEAILTALKILKKQPYSKENQLTITVIDPSNVRIMKLQAEKVLAQQKNIDRSQHKIEEQMAITRSQTTAIYSISLLLVLALILSGIIYYFLRENRKITQKLEVQNNEIRDQQNQLIEMSAKAKEASEAKFNFFTNISHEFRTPLTLIMAPLEDLMANSRLQSNTRLHIQTVQRNVIRLLRMVNQLIDFRKVELDKMEIKASENDLVQFAREVMDAFEDSAAKRGIDLKFYTSEHSLMVWFDVNMLDKVLFNMLSNAIKFTPDHGIIEVFIKKSTDGRRATISVKDNGPGMKPAEVAHAFDLFYQGSLENYKGSGLGLSLSKELVELHQGKISLESEPNKGTVIRVELLLGKSHLQATEIVTNGEAAQLQLKQNAEIYTADLAPLDYGNQEKPVHPAHEFTILLAEDNNDLLNFLNRRLGKQFDIITATDGQDAINKAFNEMPDLVISDVMMPGKTGFELTKMLKTDVRTAHIPVILLTAKTAVNHQIEGFNQLADAYISKPFNVEMLENNIQSLLRNRQKMKAHFTADNPLDVKSQGFKKADRRFVTDFSALVEANISNEHFKVDDVCSSLNISRVQLYRKVKSLLNCNVNEYILNTRLQKAKYYLQHEHLPVSEVSYKVGFSSPSYFSTVFKAKYDVSPKDFRETGVST